MRVPSYLLTAVLLLLLFTLPAVADPIDTHINFLPLIEGPVEATIEGTMTPTATSAAPTEEPVSATPTLTTTSTSPATSTATATATVPSTSSPTVTPTGTPTVESTVTPTVTPTSTPVTGGNIQCTVEGNSEICAWVSDTTPLQQTNVTVYGRLLVDGVGVPAQHMLSVWNFSTGTSGCDSGFTSLDGVATCSRGIGQAEIGYQVNIDVTIGGIEVTTWFTPTQ